jgi:nitric oxide reductase activation protein
MRLLSASVGCNEEPEMERVQVASKISHREAEKAEEKAEAEKKLDEVKKPTESATMVINTTDVHKAGKHAGKTADEMKDVFLSMKGRPQPRAVFRPEKDVHESRFFKETDPTALM